MTVQLHLSRSPGLARSGIPLRASFQTWVEKALHAAGHRRDAELSIRIVDAREGRALNRNYRQRDYATNVLSFPAELPKGVKLPLLGDLVICAPVIAREAREQGKLLRNHFAHMTIHGTLHLIGFDHLNERDAKQMEALETRVLAGFGIVVEDGTAVRGVVAKPGSGASSALQQTGDLPGTCRAELARLRVS